MSDFKKMITKENGDQVTVVVRKPTNQQLKDADIQRAKTWNKAFKEGVLTKSEVEKLMIQRGTWGSEKSGRELQLTQEILELERKLYRGDGKSKPKLSEGRKLAIEMKNKRMELRDLISERISMDENTAESLADNARFDYLVYACSYDADTGEKLFSSYEDYNSKGATLEAVTAAQLLAKMVYNLDDDFENKLPENEFLNKFHLLDKEGNLVDPKTKNLIDINGKRINKDGFYIDDDGKRIDVDGNPIDERGFYELVEYENDLVDEVVTDSTTEDKPKKTKKTSIKETETA